MELSSDFSDTYASGLEVVVVVVSAVDAIDVAGDGAGDALAVFEGISPDDGELILVHKVRRRVYTHWRL